jgi:hypothetical protein
MVSWPKSTQDCIADVLQMHLPHFVSLLVVKPTFARQQRRYCPPIAVVAAVLPQDIEEPLADVQTEFSMGVKCGKTS